MKLKGRQQLELIDAIKVLFDYNALSRVLRLIDIRIREIVGENEGMEVVAGKVVDKAIDNQWLPRLVDGLLEERADHAVLVATKAILESGPKSADGEVLACHEQYLLPGWVPFLDRKDFRAYANHFNKPGRRILTVKGGSGTGKTYSKQFIYHMARARKEEGEDQFRPVWVDLSPDSSEPTKKLVDGLAVITEIVNQIKQLKLPEKYEKNFEQQKEQAATWAKNVGSWLTGELSDSEEIYWVIIDGFSDGLTDKSAELLIDDLIRRVGNNLEAVRLILLGFDDKDFDSYSVQRHQDETKDLTDPALKDELYDELVQFVAQANAAAYEGVAEADLADRFAEDAQELIEGIDPDQSGQMQVLADELERKAQTYEQGAGG